VGPPGLQSSQPVRFMRVAVDRSSARAPGSPGPGRRIDSPAPSAASLGTPGDSMPQVQPPAELLALQRIIAGRPSGRAADGAAPAVQRQPAPGSPGGPLPGASGSNSESGSGHDLGGAPVVQQPGGGPGSGPGDRLPFVTTILGDGSGWDAAAILKSTAIEPSSTTGAAIAAGPNEVLELDRRLGEQVVQKLPAADDASTRLQAALVEIVYQVRRVSIAIILRQATHGDLIAIGALEQILSRSAVEQVSRLVEWCLALEKSDFAAVAATAKSAPASSWNAVYDEHKSFLRKPYEEFKSGLGEIRATTKGGLSENKGRPIDPLRGRGTPAAPEISFEILKECYPGLAADVARDAKKETQARAYCASLNMAFKVMAIDTVEAQANYLAHAFIESDQFRQFTETQGSYAAAGAGGQKWVDDPAKLKLDTAYLEKTYNDTSTEAGREKKGTVNPHGNFEFIGRGPVQVTHQAEYVEVIAMLETSAERYEKAAAGGNLRLSEYAALAREAANAIKADPRQAANPRYAFLVSAAFMKKRGTDVSLGWTHPGEAWTGTDIASGWVAGGEQKAGSPQAAALVEKAAAYLRIFRVLQREAKKLAV
jgi:predicted chitinase